MFRGRGYSLMESAPLSHTTSPTLLGRLGRSPTDQEAWAAFVDRYGPKIYAWCLHWRLQEADAQDVTQAVLLKLARTMARFTYDMESIYNGLSSLFGKCVREPLKMLASVLYCQPTAEGEFRHGCQFVTPLSEQQLRDVLQ